MVIPPQLPSSIPAATIETWRTTGEMQEEGRRSSGEDGNPFVAGAVVVATLGNPRDKFWGLILSLASEGLSMSGAELASFDDLVAMVKNGEPFTPAVVFFPMHRIERIELDLPDGSLPSLSQRFSAKTGKSPETALMRSAGQSARKTNTLTSRPSSAQKERE